MESKIALILAGIFAIIFGKPIELDGLSSLTQETYKKADLKKIKWIEGKWKGIYQGKPFYEIYEFINDTTLRITSYEWDGKDSSKSSRSFVYWKDGSYYLGDEMNYKVTNISDKEIKMLPNHKANNDILWKYNSNNSWKAILKSSKSATEYHMESFDPFKKTNN